MISPTNPSEPSESEPTPEIQIDASGGDSDPSSSGGGGGGDGGKGDDGGKVRVGLGPDEEGDGSSGSLDLDFTKPDEKLYRPGGINENITDPNAVVKRSEGDEPFLRQVKTANRFTDINVVASDEYTITSYSPSVATVLDDDEFYIVAPETPFQRKVTVKNPGATPILNTSDAALYHEVRWGKSFRYNLTLDNDRYKVVLNFIEFHKDTADANTFNVLAEGVTKLSALDVRAEAGARYTALTKEITTEVSDGKLNLEFKAVKGGANVAAFSVIRAPIPSVANTTDADLYQTARTGDFSYNLTLPNGSYQVSLHFIEPIHTVAAARRFDVMIEGAAALTAFDIRDKAGARDRAHIETVPVTLTDGTLDIDFLGTTDKARLSAVVVRDVATNAIVAAINAGGPAYTATDATAFVADAHFTGGTADFPGRVVRAINAGGKAYLASDGTAYAKDSDFKNGKSFAGAFNGLQVITQNGLTAPAKNFDYTWVANPETGKFDELILSHAGGLKKESRVKTWSADGLSYDETFTVFNADNTVAAKTVTIYEKFPFGLRKVRETRDPDGSAPAITTWTYVEGSSNPADPKPSGYGRVKRVIDPQGGWTDYTYNDTTRTYTNTRGSLNSAPGTLAGARVETITYSDTLPHVTTVVTIDGQEVSRSWRSEEKTTTTRTNTSITATVPGAAWNASTNLVSVTHSYTSDEADPLKRNQTAWTKAPDGTMTIYSYSKVNGVRIVERETGAPNSGQTDIVAGTRTITLTNSKGHQIGEDVIDIASGLTLSSWDAVPEHIDDLGRPTVISYGDGTTRTTNYVGSTASCGTCSSSGSYQVASEIDRNGIRTSYSYDLLNRRILTENTNVAGTITYSREATVYDAADRVVDRIRIGTDGTQISLGKTQYDPAGRVVKQYGPVQIKSFVGGVLTTLDPVPVGPLTEMAYSYPSGGGMVTTTTYPATAAGSGTRIETTYADGRTEEISGTAVSPIRYTYGTWSASGQAGEWIKEIKVGDANAETEWSKTYSDLARRTVKREYPATTGTVAATMAYNLLGQLEKQTDLDGVQTLFAYNAEGRREVTAIDLNQNNTIDYTGTDRITKTSSDVYSRSGTAVRRTTTQVWATDNTDTATTVSVSEQDGYGNQSWQTDAAGAVSATATSRTAAGAWTVTATAPDGSQQVQAYASGRLASSSTYTSTSTLITQTTFGYDAHGRVSTQTDARTGDVSYTYSDRDEILSVTSNNDTETIAYTYDALGNQLTITRPDLSVTTNEYHLRNNQLKKTYGSQTYPVEYTYDLHGRMKTLTTWQNAASSAGAAVTTWNYDALRGWLTQKLYADSTGPSYTYTPAGRLLTRTWARTVSGSPLATTYSYNNAGDLSSTDYSDTTPDVTITYTRFGAQHTVTDITGTRTFTYSTALRPEQEQLPSFYGNRILTRTYQVAASTSEPTSVPGRNNGFTLGVTGDLDSDYAVTYGYDTAGRLKTVADQNGSYTYAYLANSHLRSSATSAVHSVSYTYESHRDVITNVENKVGSTIVSNFAYAVNNLGQRTQRANTGTVFGTSSTDVFTYNTKGEVIGSTNATFPGRDQSFNYDDIGNRHTFTTTSGTTSYTANTLNQYSSVSAPFVPSVANPSYDVDGNQLTTGTGQLYTWDAENRLIAVEPVIASANDKKVLNTYDAQSRRVRRQVFTYTSGTWSLTTDEKFIYDGWNVVAKYDAQVSGLNIQVSYTWGVDLSGTFRGAGGVGGLLSAKDGSAVYHYTYDANGNVSEVLNSVGAVAAHYEYDAFGNALVSTGSYAATNTYRFSTKPLDSVGELYYYGFRYYNPSTGRWVNRDPIGETGGINVYCMSYNAGLNLVDVLGLSTEVVYTPPDPSKITPTIKATGGSFTTYPHRSVHFYCPSDQDSDEVMGSITFTAAITLSRSQAEEYKTDMDGLMGHEQAHVLSKTQRVLDGVVTPARAEICKKCKCKAEAKRLMEKYGPKLNQILNAPDGHAGEPGTNKYTPPYAKPLPPVPSTPPIK